MGGDRALLLIHGLGATGRVWDGWPALVPGRCLAPDLPGHGSAGSLDDYTFAALAAGLAATLDDATSYVVIGHSLGGVVGLELAGGRYGVQVDAVVGLGIKVEWTAAELEKAAALAARPTAWFDTRADAAARYLRVAGLTGLIEPDDPSVDAGLIERDGRWRLALDPAAFGVGAPDMATLLREGKADVVLARGEHDPMNTDQQYAALHPRVVTLPGLGHNAHVEDPAAVLGLLPAEVR
jgi:pimeloyl-ACP methyl ester carboxylesterase